MHAHHDPTGWTAKAQTLCDRFAEGASTHDADGSFVAENYSALKEHGFVSMAVPAELEGGGAGYADTCDALRILGQGCGSTALALSMHTHLVAANVWKWNHDKPSEPLLRRVAADQLVLLSTGATDWINSNGHMVKVDGGYLLTGRKVFGSGGPVADLMLTSARHEHPEQGSQVLHFPVSMKAEGVVIGDDWDTLGMRGTGSNTITLTDVFVPEGSVGLTRPANQWHPAWGVALGVAPGIYMAPYVGIAEAAVQEALRIAGSRESDALGHLAIGEMINQLTAAQLAWRAMIELANEYDFAPTLENANAQLIRKTLCSRAVQAAVTAAIEVGGARTFYRAALLERLRRDIQASTYHPLPDRKQQHFTGRVAVGLAPIW